MRESDMTPEEYKKINETINGRNIAFISYKLGDSYHCKAEIDIPGAGARLASAQGADREAVENEVREEVQQLVVQ
tara:strand:+ start:186 stop:410 length:225 start_codon:yes stop_codon:yes gene_type:complete